MKRHACAFCLCLGVLLLNGPPARSQANSQGLAALQFNFTTPGARSLGLGGAFLALADDATAAYTNPAGLTVLSKPEISLEGRSWRFDTAYTDRGHGFGPPTGTGIDTEAGPVEGSESSSTSGVSFFSIVYPKERWAFAFYRHELAKFKSSFRTQGAFLNGPESPDDLFRLLPIEASADLEITNFGASLGYRVNDRLSLGFGASLYNFDLEARVNFFNFPDETFFEEFSDYSATFLDLFSLQRGSDEDLALTAGFLFRLNDRWNLGGVFRQGPEFEFDSVRRTKFIDIEDPLVFCFAEDFPRCVANEASGTFAVPDVFGLGLAFRPTDRLLFTLDIDHVRYSQLNRNAIDIFSAGTGGDDATDGDSALLEIDDGTEIHLGVEYVFPALKYPLALRFGGWLDPDHRQRYDGPTDTLDQRGAALGFPEGDDEIHVAAGIGLVFSERFQLDAAVDISDTVATGSLSAVYRF